jgi:putative endonuclease
LGSQKRSVITLSLNIFAPPRGLLSLRSRQAPLHFVRPDPIEEGSTNTIELIMWSVYLLLCDQKIVYTGLTDDFKRRFEEHRNKSSRFTKQFSDLQLIHRENFNTETEAVKREKEIKGWSRKKKLRLLK